MAQYAARSGLTDILNDIKAACPSTILWSDCTVAITYRLPSLALSQVFISLDARPTPCSPHRVAMVNRPPCVLWASLSWRRRLVSSCLISCHLILPSLPSPLLPSSLHHPSLLACLSRPRPPSADPAPMWREVASTKRERRCPKRLHRFIRESRFDRTRPKVK